MSSGMQKNNHGTSNRNANPGVKRQRSVSPAKRSDATAQKWRRPNNYSRINAATSSTNPMHDSKKPLEEGKGGLNVELHPLLSLVVTASSLPKSQGPHMNHKRRQNFDLHAINPYLNQQDASGKTHRPRNLELNAPGKYVAIAERERAREQELQALERKQKEKAARGLAPDESLGEHLYLVRPPPSVEWWDRPFLPSNEYPENPHSRDLKLDNPAAPVTLYIEHPVLVSAPSELLLQESGPMHLTKDEQKRIRRNERLEKNKEKQDRIRLGLDPPPPPKVKLANLMNVLTNEAIKDPTAVELKVRQEVQQRFADHMKVNEERKLTPEQRHEKEHQARQKDVQKGLFRAVFKVNLLSVPQHEFKVNINAKQLELVGVCLHNPKFNLVIVEGGAKAIKFYKKLMLSRIKWTEALGHLKNISQHPSDKHESHNIQRMDSDTSTNECLLLWEGPIMEPKFQKWSSMYSQTDEEALTALARFQAENYWRQAAAAVGLLRNQADGI